MAMRNSLSATSGQKRSADGGSTVLLLGLLVCGLAGSGCGLVDSMGSGEASASEDQKLTASVQKGVIQVSVTEDGEVESAKPVVLKCMVAGGAQILEIVPDGTKIVEKGGQKEDESDVFVGDQIVKLDDSKIKDALDQQQIKVGNAENALILAEKDLSLAKISVNEYEKGTFVQELQGLDAEVTIAMENLRGAENQFEYTQKMFRKGFVTKLQLEADEFAVKRSNLELAQSETKRKVLVDFTKEKMLEDLRSAVKTATSGVKQKQSALDLEKRSLSRITEQFKNCVIVAPKPGMVVYHNERSRWGRSQSAQIEEGATVREHQAIVKLPDFTKMQVKVSVHESKVQQVAVGDRASLTIQGYNEPLSGVVVEIANQPEQASWYQAKVKEYATIVKIDEIPAGMVPGMSAEVVIDVEERSDVLKLPVESVIEIGGEFFAWSSGADGSGYEKKKLDVVKSEKGDARVLTDSKFIAVNGGVAENELVVLNPRDTVAEAKELILADEEQQAKKKSSAVVAKASTGAPGRGAGKGAKKKSGRPARGGNAAGGRGGSGGGGGFTGANMLKAMDKDSDGKVSKEESPDRMKAGFDGYDTNSDGFLDKAELDKMVAGFKSRGSKKAAGGSKKSSGDKGGKKKASGGAAAFSGASLLRSMDKNSDGKVSKDEAPDRMKATFDASDTNSDGFLDEAELDKVAEAIRARFRGAGAGGQ
jgi:HlyD family secretion protein